jgi:hypothetical protein
MASNRYDFDVRVHYAEGGFESLEVKQKLDAADAIAAAAQTIRRKQRAHSVYRTVASIEAVKASHEAYRK